MKFKLSGVKAVNSLESFLVHSHFYPDDNNDVMRFYLLGVFFFLFVEISAGQDTALWYGVDTLPETVMLNRNSTDNVIESHQISLESVGLSQYLHSELGINVRRNSINGLSTINYRGYNSNQTRITWNDLPLNSPMNGAIDLSLVPFFLLDKATFEEEDGKSTFTTAVGDRIGLRSNGATTHFNGTKLNVIGAVGRFGRLMGGSDVQYRLGKSKLFGRTRIFYNTGQNNYSFTSYTGETKTLRNAEFEGYGLVQNLSYQKWDLSVWIQHFDRNIPPTLGENVSRKNQIDDHVRATLTGYPFAKRPDFKVFYGVSLEDLQYTDQISRINSDNRSSNQFIALEDRLRFKNQNNSLLIGTDAQISFAKTSNYGKIDPITIATPRIDFESKLGRFTTNLGLKTALFEDTLAVLMPSIKVHYISRSISKKDSVHFISHIQAQGAAQFPTLNMLYWSPGGNPHLQPETSNKVEISAGLRSKRWHLLSEVFGSDIHNLLQWRPIDGTYQAAQVEGVTKLRGLETKLVYQGKAFDVGKNLLKFRCKITHTYTSARNSNLGDNQMIYIPEHQGAGTVGLYHVAGWYIGWVQNWTSRRYLTTTNDDWLAGFSLSDVVVTYNSERLMISFRGNNVTGKTYFMLPDRPMPRQDFQLIFNYKINLKND